MSYEYHAFACSVKVHYQVLTWHRVLFHSAPFFSILAYYVMWIVLQIRVFVGPQHSSAPIYIKDPIQDTSSENYSHHFDVVLYFIFLLCSSIFNSNV